MIQKLNLRGKKALLLSLCWLCAAISQHTAAQPAAPSGQHIETILPALLCIVEHSPESFPPTLAPLLTHLMQQKPWWQVETLLDAYTLLEVQINPEARVKLRRGNAKRMLTVGVKRLFLVKVVNEAGTTASLQITTPEKSQADWLSVRVIGTALPGENAALSGQRLEYCLLELCSRVKGVREAAFSADIGQGTQDLGFRSEIAFLLQCSQSPKKQSLRIKP